MLGVDIIMVEFGVILEVIGSNGNGGCYVGSGGGVGGMVVLFVGIIVLDGDVKLDGGNGGDFSGNVDGGKGGDGWFL